MRLPAGSAASGPATGGRGGRVQRAGIAGVLVVLILGLPVLALELTGCGSWGIVLVAAGGLALVVGGAAALATPFRRLRPRAARVVAFSAVIAIGAVGFLRASGEARHWAFARLAERSRPLVAAIGEYQARTGEPPGTLDDLVPTVLTQVPGTAMPAYPHYEYEVFDAATDFRRKDLGSPWELRVPCPLGLLNWDVFFYWPSEVYPDHIYGGSVERIGRWAYVHE